LEWEILNADEAKQLDLSGPASEKDKHIGRKQYHMTEQNQTA
jgi:hypothetical protein